MSRRYSRESIRNSPVSIPVRDGKGCRASGAFGILGGACRRFSGVLRSVIKRGKVAKPRSRPVGTAPSGISDCEASISLGWHAHWISADEVKTARPVWREGRGVISPSLPQSADASLRLDSTLNYTRYRGVINFPMGGTLGFSNTRFLNGTTSIFGQWTHRPLRRHHSFKLIDSSTPRGRTRRPCGAQRMWKIHLPPHRRGRPGARWRRSDTAAQCAGGLFAADLRAR